MLFHKKEPCMIQYNQNQQQYILTKSVLNASKDKVIQQFILFQSQKLACQHILQAGDSNLLDYYIDNKGQFCVDLDIKLVDKKTNGRLFTQTNSELIENFDGQMPDLINYLLNSFNIILNQHNKIIVLEAHCEDKISYHIHFVGVYILGINSLASTIISIQNSYTDNKLELKKYLDGSLYAQSHAFRTLGQSKIGQNNKLKIDTIYNHLMEIQDNSKFDINDIMIQKPSENSQIIDACKIKIQLNYIKSNVDYSEDQFKQIKKQSISTAKKFDNKSIDYSKYHQQMKKLHTKLDDDEVLKPMFKNYYQTKSEQQESYIDEELITKIYMTYHPNKSNQSKCIVCDQVHNSNGMSLVYLINTNYLFVYCQKTKQHRQFKDYLLNFQLKKTTVKQWSQKKGIKYEQIMNKNIYDNVYLDTENQKLDDCKKHMFIYSRTATGKSQFVIKKYKSNHCLMMFICTRISMKNDLVKKCIENGIPKSEIYDYENDIDKINQLQHGSKGILLIVLNSVHNVYDFSKFTHVIIDECQFIQSLLLNCLDTLVKIQKISNENTQLIFMDALMNPAMIEFYQLIFHQHDHFLQSDNQLVIENIYKPEHTYIIVRNQELSKIQTVQKVFDSLYQSNNDLRFTVSSDCRQILTDFKNYIISHSQIRVDQILFLHGECDPEYKAETMTNIEQIVQDQDIRIIMYTPTIIQSVSIINPLFSKHISLIAGTVISNQSLYQQLFRSRCCQLFITIIDNEKNISEKQYQKNFDILPQHHQNYYQNQLYHRLQQLYYQQQYSFAELIDSQIMTYEQFCSQFNLKEQQLVKVHYDHTTIEHLKHQDIQRMIKTGDISKLESLIEDYNIDNLDCSIQLQQLKEEYHKKSDKFKIDADKLIKYQTKRQSSEFEIKANYVKNQDKYNQYLDTINSNYDELYHNKKICSNKFKYLSEIARFVKTINSKQEKLIYKKQEIIAIRKSHLYDQFPRTNAEQLINESLKLIGMIKDENKKNMIYYQLSQLI